MNPRALIRIAGHLLGEFRVSGLAADRAADHFFRLRRFLGAKDRRFVAGTFYHVLRHLRRFDEAIDAAFADTRPAITPAAAGFPVSHPGAGARWFRPLAREPLPQSLHVGNPDAAEEWIDTTRAALATVELGLVAADVATPEIVDVWSRAAAGAPALNGSGSITILNSQAAEKSVRERFARAIEVSSEFARDTSAANAARALSFPEWLWPHLAPWLSHDERVALGRSLAAPAPVTLRVNTLRCSAEEARAALERAGITARPGDWSPVALILESRITPSRVPYFDDGWLEFQDEASQLCSMYAATSPGMTVIDACAGGGGKSLHLAALMGNHGRIVACDVAPSRLDQLDRRRVRAGTTIIETQRLGPDAAPPDGLGADIVLIDAPCSGTGTLRRAPDLRWRLSPEMFVRICEEQGRLLERWSPVVAPGGVLVYATCSLTGDENAAQIDRFLESHPEFRRDTNPPKAFQGERAALLSPAGELELYPHRQGCDGFFASRLRRSTDVPSVPGQAAPR